MIKETAHLKNIQKKKRKIIRKKNNNCMIKKMNYKNSYYKKRIKPKSNVLMNFINFCNQINLIMFIEKRLKVIAWHLTLEKNMKEYLKMTQEIDIK